MKRRRSFGSHARINPSNRHYLLLLICTLTGRNLLVLAVTAAAIQVKPLLKSRLSSPLKPWTHHCHVSKSSGGMHNNWWRWILNNLLNHSTCSSISNSVFKSLVLRGGEANNDDLDLSDIDDDIPAEDLLDAIFDNHNDLNDDKRKRRPIKTSDNEKLQASIKKKATHINLESLDALIESDSQEKSLSTMIPSNAKKSSKQQQKIMNLRQNLAPQLGSRSRPGASTSTLTTASKSSSDRYLNRSFRHELDRLSKQPSPLSPRKTSRSKPSSGRSGYESYADEKSRRQRSSNNSFGEELFADSHISEKRNEETHRIIDEVSRNQEVINFAASRKVSAPETSSMQQIRAAPTVSTSGISRPPSPAFVRRRSPATVTKTNSPTASKHHAVWGPHVHHRKTKPGPPPTKATEDERRAHETQSLLRQERRKLLSNLAIRMNDSHTAAIKALIRGSAAHIPPELFGQTIMQEKSACNEKFYGRVTEVQSSLEARDSVDMTVLGEEIDTTPSFRHIEDPTLLSYWGLTPHAKLYGVRFNSYCPLIFQYFTHVHEHCNCTFSLVVKPRAPNTIECFVITITCS